MGLCRWCGYIEFPFEFIAKELMVIAGGNLRLQLGNKNVLKKLGYLNETF